MKYGIKMTAKKENDDMIKILLDISYIKGSHDMKSILATRKIFSETWAKNSFQKIAETEKVTQDNYLYRLKSKVIVINQRYHY